MNSKPLIIIPLIAALTACGGGGGGTPTTSLNSTQDTSTGQGTVSVLITDNLTLTYSEVWVNVQSISATDANGQVVSLYQDATGQVHNLSQLVNIGALVDATTIAAGIYTSFEIILANDIKLVDNGGVITNATFDQTGNPNFTLTVTGNLTVDANQVATLLLDFDLQQFTYDAATNTVNPVVVQKDPAQLNQTVATTNGQVQSVTNATQFVLTPATGGANITVNLHANATVTNAGTGAVTADTAALQAGMQVSVTGNYDATALTLSASGVQIGSNTVVIRHEVEGVVTAFDGSNLTMDVKEATFLPSSNTLAIANTSNSVFSAGSLSMLAVGQKVEIKGDWDDASFTAAIIEIEGAPRNAGVTGSYADDYTEIKGQITAVNQNQFTFTVREFENVSGISVGDSLNVDSSNSWFEDGNSTCLVVGAVVETKGPMVDGANIVANVIEFESGCGNNSSNDSDDDDD